jgi:tRNA-Thr(GGU) m(6)t(6)A37 methyltransferase TsaA
MPYSFEPIGVVRSPFAERASAPRQPSVGAVGNGGDGEIAAGRIELFAGHGYEDALDGLAQWEYAWVVFVFHRNVEEARGWRPKVQPPRSDAGSGKKGVFATRSPHRPNPIGLSAVRIERVEGLDVHVSRLDMLDGTPVLDLKPYVAYADAYPSARDGWLAARDPIAPWEVAFSDLARAQLGWLRASGVDLQPGIETALALGPQPHAYRRIRPQPGAGGKRDGNPTAMRLALKEWRVDFVVEGEARSELAAMLPQARRLVVTAVLSGYRAKQLAEDPSLGLHREYESRFAASPAGLLAD